MEYTGCMSWSRSEKGSLKKGKKLLLDFAYRVLGLSIARDKFPHLDIKQVVEEERVVLGTVFGRRIRIKPESLLGFFK